MSDLEATRDAPVGGQAVLEGVMMRGVSTWAVAVRRPDGEVATESFPLVSVLRRHRALRLPVVRGAVALYESLAVGFRALAISANAQLPEDEHPAASGGGHRQEEIGKGVWAGTVIAALALSVGLFFLLPAGLASLSGVGEERGWLFVVVEKVIRLSVFLGYLWLVSRLRDLQRVFAYHGAEHKTISCYEAGRALTPENAQRFSRFHPRCGTSFLLIVMIVSFFVLVPLGRPEWYFLYPSRVVAIPLVAGLAFELIKLLGRNRTKRWARVLTWPGIQLQRLTTREPDLAQLAVAVAALEAVLAVETPGQGEADELGLEVAA